MHQEAEFTNTTLLLNEIHTLHQGPECHSTPAAAQLPFVTLRSGFPYSRDGVLLSK